MLVHVLDSNLRTFIHITLQEKSQYRENPPMSRLVGRRTQLKKRNIEVADDVTYNSIRL